MEHDGCKGCAFERNSDHKYPCIRCEGTKEGDLYKKITWAEKIRTMNNEELAILISKLTYTSGHPAIMILRWLESGYKEDQ